MSRNAASVLPARGLPFPGLLSLVLLSLVLLAPSPPSAATDPDPLPSWRAGEVKAAILAFVAAVSDSGGPDFVPASERIAVLDNDGTSWCERPDYVPTLFQADLLRGLVAEGRIDGDAMPYRAWIADDQEALRDFGWRESYEALTRALVGIDIEEYREAALAYLERRRHERFDRPYTELYYAPMLELIDLLEARDFQVWIVTGAEQAFVQSYSEQVLGIPPARVIGSWVTPVYENDDGEVRLTRGDVQVPNGYEHKPENIAVRIGRRPIFAAGNSNNDEPMCRYALTGKHRSLAIWIHHDDPDREYEYGRRGSRIEELCEENPAAYEVSMRRDWARVFR
ncbi:haloacid dehalogenase-like hydrolase [bacterium]|nr:haloacid dehalogenase-like hydrolase [bacterium]